MVDESLLRDTLVLVTEEHKNIYKMLSGMLRELAALRETVRGLDPTFSEVLQNRQWQMTQKLSATVAERERAFDKLIEKAQRVVYSN